MNDCSQNLGPRLRYLNNRITQYMDQQFLALDLTSTQSFILHHLSLHEHEAVYPKDLEKRFHLTHPTVSGVLQRLEAKNFIIIEPDKADRRCKRIRLTDRARRCDEAVGQAGQPVGPAEGFGEPAGHPQVLGLRGQQGLAQPDHAPPVGLLDVGHPLALGEGRVVEAAGLLDLVEGGRKAQVAAAGLVGEGECLEQAGVVHGVRLECRTPSLMAFDGGVSGIAEGTVRTAS